jgi:holo-[acyl-carrier protein] synthase
VILGCGIDLIEVGRIERELTRRGQDPFDDLFTADELAWCRRRRSPAEAYALGFAAKEAIVKALGTGLVGKMAWTDIRVCWPEPCVEPWPAGDARGGPTVSLHGATAAAADELGVDRVHLTATLTRPTRSRLKPASTTDGARYSRGPAPAGSRTGAIAAAWVVLTGDSELAPRA